MFVKSNNIKKKKKKPRPFRVTHISKINSEEDLYSLCTDFKSHCPSDELSAAMCVLSSGTLRPPTCTIFIQTFTVCVRGKGHR